MSTFTFELDAYPPLTFRRSSKYIRIFDKVKTAKGILSGQYSAYISRSYVLISSFRTQGLEDVHVVQVTFRHSFGSVVCLTRVNSEFISST